MRCLAVTVSHIGILQSFAAVLLSLWTAVLLPVAAFLIGIVSAMTGLGGGSLMVPMMVILSGLTAHKAVGTSLCVIVFTALSSTLAYSRQGRVDYKLGAAMALGTVPGGIVGAYATKFVSPGRLGLIFGIFLVLVGLRMILSRVRREGERKSARASGSRSWNRRLVDSEGEVFEYEANVKIGAPLAFTGGFVSGFLGVGGGVLMVPILNLIVGLPIHLAVAASMFIMIFTSSFGASMHILLGNVVPTYVVLLASGIVLGAQAGAYLAKRAKPKYLRAAFGAVAIFAGLRMILKSL